MRVEAPALLGEVRGRRPQERAGSPRAGSLLLAYGSPGVPRGSGTRAVVISRLKPSPPSTASVTVWT
jgi:hypothetical protein